MTLASAASSLTCVPCISLLHIPNLNLPVKHFAPKLSSLRCPSINIPTSDSYISFIKYSVTWLHIWITLVVIFFFFFFTCFSGWIVMKCWNKSTLELHVNKINRMHNGSSNFCRMGDKTRFGKWYCEYNVQCVPEKRKPINQVYFSETVMIYQKKFTLLQNSVYPLSFDTSYKMYWPCMAKQEPFQMVMSKIGN